MTRRFAVFLFALLPGVEVLAQPATVTVNREDCQRLVRHVPAADVTYQPGVDVYGREVAPADLNGGVQIALPDTYSFDIEIQPIDFARRRQLDTQRAVLTQGIAANAAEAEALATEAGLLAARDEAVQRGFQTQAQAIIDATGGPSQTNQTILATRTARLDALRTNTLASPEVLALQAEIAANQQALANNAAEASFLEQQQAAIDQEQALIDRRGLNATTMTVGQVTVTTDGRVTFNGQPLLDEEQAELAARCQEVLR